MSFVKKYFVKTVCILLALLFVYAAFSKMLDFEAFQVQLAQSPLLSAYAGFVSYSIIVIEIVVAVFLCMKETRLLALYASLGLMAAFTAYIYIILNYSEFIPCSCGGILEKLGWEEHLIFNIFFVLLSGTGIFILERHRGISILRTVLFSCSTVIVSCLFILGLFLSSEYIIKKENNFTRRFLQYPIIENGSVSLDNADYYFAGSDGGHIYLGSRNRPQILTTVDTAFLKIGKLKILPDNLKHKFKKIEIQVKSPFYYFYDGTVPVIYRGKLGDPQAATVSIGDAFFTQLAVLDSLNFAIRTQSSETKELIMGSLDLNRKPKVKLSPGVLQKQVDGFFDVDGKLITGGEPGNLVYTYSYRNQFIVLDKNLSVLNRFNTIDTTTRAKVSTVSMSDGRHKISAPPLKVNGKATANADYIFIISELLGKHESRESWKNAKVVDVYRLNKQEYLGSFYLYKNNGKNISDILVTDKHLYTIVGEKLQRFYFRKPLHK